MGDASYSNAMTEVALALAMAFFAIMVLAMVSMGAPQLAAQTTASTGTPVKLTLASPALTAGKPQKAKGKKALVVFWEGRFFDKDLKPIRIEEQTFPNGAILALSPELSMAKALKARARLKTRKLVVSTLDARWLNTLTKMIHKEQGQ